MGIGNRIKQCREALNITQDELALRLGYTSRSSIAKIETGKNDMPISKLVAFARALNVPPGYLLGSNDKPIGILVTETEQRLLEKVRKLKDISALETYIDFLITQQNKEEW